MPPRRTARTGSLGLRDRAERIARELSGSIGELVARLAGKDAKPARLIARGLDKSLASRVVRALRAEPEVGALSTFPGPHGLRMLVERAREVAPRAALERAERAIAAYEAFAGEFVGGRSEMLAVISEWLPDGRAALERAARQRLYRAWVEIAGKREEARLWSAAVAPSADPATPDVCDHLAVSMSRGLRRLRPGSPVTLTGIDKLAPGRVRSLDGRPAVEDPRALAVEPFSSAVLDRIRVFEDEHQLWLYLPAEEPPVNEPVDLALALVSPGAWRRYAEPDEPEEFENTSIRFPVGSYTSDLLLHEEIGLPELPEITTSVASFAPPRSRDDALHVLNRIELDVAVEDLGRLDGSGAGLRVDDAPSYPDLVRHAFRRLGWDLARFRAYRFRLAYPAPFVWYNWCVPLPRRA